MKRDESNFSPALPPQIEAAAVRWLGLRDAGNMTSAQEAEFAAWLEADERHHAAFVAIEETWADFDTLKSLKPAIGDADPDLLVAAQMTATPRLSNRVWKFVPTSLAAAAAITIGCLAWWHTRGPALLTETVVTHVGGQNTLKLPDGSTLQMNTATAVEVHFGATERRVRLLRGEAHFTVAKDRARPFVVNVGSVAVRAIGTAFNVRIESNAVEVFVTQGKVRVDVAVSGSTLLPSTAPTAAAPVLATESVLVAGNRVVIPVEAMVAPASASPPAIASMAPAEIARALAWREQRLEFADSPLAEVIAEFNRYNAHKLVIADPRLMQQRFGGKFRPDGYEGLVRMLESSFGVQVERRDGETLLRLPAEATDATR